MIINKENAEEVLSCYEQGIPSDQMGFRFGIHPTYVRRAVERAARILGVPLPAARFTRKKKMMRCSDDEAAFLVEACGVVLAAELAGVSASTLIRRMQDSHPGVRRDKEKFPRSLYDDIISSGISITTLRDMYEDKDDEKFYC